MSIKVGSNVKFKKERHIFTYYGRWAAEKKLHGFVDSAFPDVDKEYKVVAIGEHHYNATEYGLICGIRDELTGQEFIASLKSFDEVHKPNGRDAEGNLIYFSIEDLLPFDRVVLNFGTFIATFPDKARPDYCLLTSAEDKNYVSNRIFEAGTDHDFIPRAVYTAPIREGDLLNSKVKGTLRWKKEDMVKLERRVAILKEIDELETQRQAIFAKRRVLHDELDSLQD